MKNKTYIAKYLHKLRKLAALAFLILHSSFFISCSDDYTLSDAELEATQAIAATSGKLRFIPDETSTNTRLTYSGDTTTFDNGDAVGCIICQLSTNEEGTTDTTYVATSKWVYNTTYNTFMIQRYWTTQDRTTDNPSGFTGNTTTTTSSKTRADDDTGTTTSTTLYAYEPTEGDLTNFFISYETTENKLTDSSDDDDLGGGYTIISETITDDNPLLFFFYYPYIDPFETTWVTTSTGDTLSSDSDSESDSESDTYIHCWPTDESGSYLAGFPAGEAGYSFNTSSIYTSTISDNDTTQSTRTPSYTNSKVNTSYNWRQMPYFVCMDQDATSPMALQASDMLYVRYSSGVSSSTAGNLRLSFAKMGSTLRILSTTDIVNARLVCYSSTSSDSETDDDGVTYYPYTTTTPITVGQCIDLATGYLTDVPSDNDTLSSQNSCQQLSSTSYALRGRNYTYTTAYDVPNISGVTIATPSSAVRLHLPPQDGFKGKLAFQYEDDFSNLTNYSDSVSGDDATDFSKATYYANHASEVAWHYLDLSGLGGDDGTLESGTRYTVNAFSMDDSWICFNSSGAQATLNGAYLTVGVEDDSKSVSDHNSLDSSVSIPYPNTSSTYSYYLKMQNSAGDYLGVYVPTVMTLTMYFVKSSSVKSSYTDPTTVLVYRTKDINFSGTDYYASPTLTEDSTNSYLMTSLKLTEGYYRVRRSGGDTWLLLAVLSM